MDIKRSGSERNHGTTTLVSDVKIANTPNKANGDFTYWSEATKTLNIFVRGVPHSGKKSHHDYEIVLTLDDVAELINVLAHSGASENPRLLRDNLTENIPALVKLLAYATGFTTHQIPPDNASQ